MDLAEEAKILLSGASCKNCQYSHERLIGKKLDMICSNEKRISISSTTRAFALDCDPKGYCIFWEIGTLWK